MDEAGMLAIGHGEFQVTPEHDNLRETVRRFCRGHGMSQQQEGPDVDDRGLWRQLAMLGVLALDTPAARGGEGGTLVDQAIVIEELGRELFPGPVCGTIMLGTSLLSAIPSDEAAHRMLGRIADGTTTVAVALPPQPLDASPAITAVRSQEQLWRLTGQLDQVIDGDADLLLLVLETRDGNTLFGVARDAVGLAVDQLCTLDLSRRQSRVSMTGTPAHRLAAGEDVNLALARMYDRAAILMAAEQLGGAQLIFESALNHAKQRMQFGRPIGSFQAVKHRLTDMLVALEHARSVTYYAAWNFDQGHEDPSLLSSMARAVSTEVFTRVAGEALQIFGGTGFTWEHHAHRYYKRAISDAISLGTADEHWERLAARLLDNAPLAEAGTVDGRGTGD